LHHPTAPLPTSPKGEGKELNPTAPLTIAVSRDTARNSPRVAELTALGVEVFALPPLGGNPRRLDLAPLFRHLASAHGATNILIEGGATLLGSLFAQKLADEVLVFIAPKIAGDTAAISAVCGLDCAAMNTTLPLRPRAMRRFGDDVLLEYRLR
jgi:diaminohydroxyphosphoribosylaminopyrimidine deaminase/5-amino-6-(5-phosphoribosylamino)uracil reductase